MNKYEEAYLLGNTEFDDVTVGALALITAYQIVKLFLFQFGLMVLMGIIMVISNIYDFDKTTEEYLMLSCIFIYEPILIFILIRKGKEHFYHFLKIKNDKIITMSETQLEIVFGLGALFGLCWCWLIGTKSAGFEIFMLIVESAAFLFLFVFVIIRYLVTHQIRRSAILCLLLTGLSIYFLIN